MNTSDDASLIVLNSLIQIGKDAEQGLQTAAMAIKDSELAKVLSEYAGQRTRMIRDLQDRVRLLRAEPQKTGSLASAAHRAWMDLQPAIASNETHSILAECERGEALAVAVYREALQQPDVDALTRDLVQRQYELVQAAHDRIRQLRDKPEYAHR